MALNELFIKNIKVKKRKLFHDDRNLYLDVYPTGAMVWKFRYWENKKERKISIGRYPAISLKEARVKRDELALRQEKGLPIVVSEKSSDGSPVTFQEVAL